MLLAIDTSTRLTSIALHDGHRILSEKTWHTGNYHTVELAPAVEDMLAESKIGPDDLTALAAAQGPGSFTGLRIGMAFAKGVASTCTLPLFGVPTLDIIAAAQPYVRGSLYAVLKAGRGRLSVGRYTWRAKRWRPRGDAFLAEPADLLRQITRSALLAGEVEMIELPPRSPITLAAPARSLRRAGWLAEIAWERYNAGERPQAAGVGVIYIH